MHIDYSEYYFCWSFPGYDGQPLSFLSEFSRCFLHIDSFTHPRVLL